MAETGATDTPDSRYRNTAFPMIEVPRIPPKLRSHSMLLMSEVGMPLRVTEDLIEIAAPLIDLGFAGVEMSEDTMEPLDPGHRDDLVAQAQDMGLKVMTEMGRKNLDKPFEVEEIIEQIHHDLSIGVSHVCLESSEIQALYDSDPSALDRLAALGKNEFLLFELGLVQSQEKAAWLVERYGTEINFASVAPADVVAVDAIRRGIHRKANYRAMM